MTAATTSTTTTTTTAALSSIQITAPRPDNWLDRPIADDAATTEAEEADNSSSSNGDSNSVSTKARAKSTTSQRSSASRMAKNKIYKKRERRGRSLIKKAQSFHDDVGDDVLLVLKSSTSNSIRFFCSRPSLANEFILHCIETRNSDAKGAKILASPLPSLLLSTKAQRSKTYPQEGAIQ